MDKKLLFVDRLPRVTVEVPGGEVTVRGLSRAEVVKLNDAGPGTAERTALRLGLVDPVLTDAEVGEWLAAWPAGDIQPVVEKIMELSGLNPGAAKEQYKSLRDGSEQ